MLLFVAAALLAAVAGRTVSSHAEEAAVHAGRAGKEAAEAAQHAGQATAEIPQTLADRVTSFFKLRPKGVIEDAVAGARELQDELMKATGLKSKTIGDRVEDALEAIHLKEPSAAKAAAEKIAHAIPGTGGKTGGIADMDFTHLAPDLKEQLSGILSGTSQVGTVWDKALKNLGLRERSMVEKAAAQYYSALHEMKVALGAEDRTLGEKLNHAVTDATGNLKDVMHAAGNWVKFGAEETAPPPSISVLNKARSTWEDASAKALASFFRARDAATSATDQALIGAGLKEERKSAIGRARDNMDAAFHRLGLALGWSEPTTLEKLRAYTPAGLRSSSQPTEGIASTLGSVPEKAADSLQYASHVTRAQLDRFLKDWGLRDKSTAEKAADQFHGTMRSFKQRIGIEDVNARDRFSTVMEEQNNRVMEALQTAFEALPPAVQDTPTALSDAAYAVSPGRLPDTLRHQYAIASAKLSDALETAQESTDRALKNIGWREKSTGEALRDNVTEAWHNLKVQIGLEKPGVYEQIQYAVGTKPGLAGGYDRMLKRLHIRDKSGVEKAEEGFIDAYRKMKVALGAEDPALSERVMESLSYAKDALKEAAQSTAQLVPGGKTLGEALDIAPEPVAAGYRRLSKNTIEALLRARAQTDHLLKEAHLKERKPLEKAKHELDRALESTWIALGYEEPGMLGKAGEAWHVLKQKVGLEEPPHPGLYSRVKAYVVDAATGEPQPQPGILGSMKAKLFGG